MAFFLTKGVSPAAVLLCAPKLRKRPVALAHSLALARGYQAGRLLARQTLDRPGPNQRTTSAPSAVIRFGPALFPLQPATQASSMSAGSRSGWGCAHSPTRLAARVRVRMREVRREATDRMPEKVPRQARLVLTLRYGDGTLALAQSIHPSLAP
ncbi:hypothetical protein G7Z17_g5976 [Cylindrodendrum hubeiense]|uniref:Uncharacterized protein n=1 Tax=Cylindrodendrum hubeiense TaxID=595255 RepID=A0A9P5H5N5_9HYPO|nr:hypothetical protein G7Z17_g5976 [Cylindrodendrum hubeiense]